MTLLLVLYSDSSSGVSDAKARITSSRGTVSPGALKGVSRERRTAKQLWGKVARSLSELSSAKMQKTPGSFIAEWDVFISYRVKADAKLAESLYWQLSSTEIQDHATTRKLRVFWDKGVACAVGP